MRSINRIRADGAIHHVRYSDVSTQNIRGAASVDGANYYIQAGGGIRFVLGDPTLDLSPSGTVFTHNNATNFQSIHIQTLTTFRGVAIAANTPGGPQLFTAWSAAPGNCGLFSVGAGLPTAVGTTSALQLNCTLFNMGAFNSFHFQDVNTLWAGSALALFKFTAAPRSGQLRLLNTTWQLAPGYPVNQSNGGGLRYLTGRLEGANYAIYGVSDVFAGSTALLRHVAGSASWGVLAQSGANKWFRGVFLPPCDPAINGPCDVLSPTAFPTPSVSPSSSVAPSSTASSSATRSATASGSRTRTPSASLTASPSATASITATPSATLPAGVSPSATSSLSSSASPTPSRAPYIFNPASIVLWRLGTGAAIPVTHAAQPYFFDEVTIAPGGASASLLRSVPLPTSGDAACTGALNTVAEGGGSLSWDGRFIVAPCFTAPVGTTAANTNASWPFRQIVRLGADSDVKLVRWSESTASNIRGAATTNGIDFWTSSGGGVRYLPTDASIDYLPANGVYVAPASVSLVVQTITNFRGIGFVATAPEEPQLFTAYSQSSSVCGLYTVGVGAPTATTTMVQRLNCAAFAMSTFIGFHSQDVNTLWAISTSSLFKFVAAPRNGTLTGLTTVWTLAPGYPQAQPLSGLRYLSGRFEAGNYAIYAVTDAEVATSQTYLLRHVAGSAGFTTLLASGANRYFRGVYLAPCDEAINGAGACGGASPSAFPSPSNTATSTGSNTASVSATASVSPSYTPTTTATNSLSPGVSVSATATEVPSSSPSPTAAPYKFQPASIVVWRLGSGAAPMVATEAQPYYVDEYAVSANGSAATLTRSVPMPQDGPAACTGSLLTTFEGGGAVTFDGRYLVTQCFTGPVGTSSINSNTQWPLRQINRIGGGSDLKFTRYSDIGTQNIRGVASLNGRDYYAQAGGGIRLILGDPALDDAPSGTVVLLTAASASATVASQTTTNFRGVSIAANTADSPQLLTSWSASSTNCGMLSFGTGLPTTLSTVAVTQLNCSLFNMGSFLSHHVQDVNTLWAVSSAGLFRLFRGVFLPPCDPAINGPCDALSPTAFPTPSTSVTPSVPPSSTASTSATRSATASGSRTRTSSASLTASVSSTASATPSPTASVSIGVSVSATASITGSASATPSNAPFKFSTGSIVVLTIGTGLSVPTTTVTLPMAFQEFAPSAASATLIRTVPLPSNAGNRSCTGSHVGPLFEGGGSLSWDGRFIVAPCTPYPAGTMTAYGTAFPFRGSVRIGAGSDLKLTRYNDSSTAQSRGAVTIDGTTAQLWLSGASARYLALDPAIDASPSGTQYSSPNQPVVVSMPAGSFFRHGTVVSDAPGVPQVIASYSASASNCGLYAIGAPGPLLNTTGQAATLLLNGSQFGMGSFAGHHVESVDSLWAISSGALWKFVARPRAAGPVRFVNTSWQLAPGYPVNQSLGGGLRYLTGRSERTDYVVYATSDVDAASGQTYLLRHVAGSAGFTLIASSGFGKFFRGIYLPPCDPAINGPCDALSPTAFPTPSVSPSSSVAPSVSSSPSATRSASTAPTTSATPSASTTGTRSGTPSASSTRSGTASITGTRTGTPSPSATATGSVSATSSETASVSATASPTASVSATQTGTPSSSATGTGTPSSSATETGTPSSSQTGTGTPSSSNTGTPASTQSSSLSSTGTRTPAVSGTATKTRVSLPSSSPTRTRTRTGTASRTKTKTRTRTKTPSKKKKLLRV